MPIDNDVWLAPACQGDVAGVAIRVATTIDAIVEALAKVQAKLDVDLATEISDLQGAASELSGIFDELTGWSADD